MLYTAFMADIVNSKKLLKADRGSIQVFIKACLDALNNVFRPSIEFEVIFSAGDEVQGLFRNPEAAYLYLRLFQMILSPLQIRCGIGVGEWEVRIPGGTSSEQDGSAYHYAREAISNAHKRKGNAALFYSSSKEDFFINASVATSILLMKRQSPNQNQIFMLIELLQPLYNSDHMNLKALEALVSLIEKKAVLGNFISSKSTNKTGLKSCCKNEKDLIFQFALVPEPYEYVSSLFRKDNMELDSTIKKGLSSKIANITDTSRQNIEKTIKAANITEIRNLDAAILLMLRQLCSDNS